MEICIILNYCKKILYNTPYMVLSNLCKYVKRIINNQEHDELDCWRENHINNIHFRQLYPPRVVPVDRYLFTIQSEQSESPGSSLNDKDMNKTHHHNVIMYKVMAMTC